MLHDLFKIMYLESYWIPPTFLSKNNQKKQSGISYWIANVNSQNTKEQNFFHTCR